MIARLSLDVILLVALGAVASGETVPSTELSVEESITTQLQLLNASLDDSDIDGSLDTTREQLFDFIHPGTHSMDNVRRIGHINSIFDKIARHGFDGFAISPSDDKPDCRNVSIVFDGRSKNLTWCLAQFTSENCDSCWMTDTVALSRPGERIPSGGRSYLFSAFGGDSRSRGGMGPMGKGRHNNTRPRNGMDRPDGSGFQGTRTMGSMGRKGTHRGAGNDRDGDGPHFRPQQKGDGLMGRGDSMGGSRPGGMERGGSRGESHSAGDRGGYLQGESDRFGMDGMSGRRGQSESSGPKRGKGKHGDGGQTVVPATDMESSTGSDSSASEATYQGLMIFFAIGFVVVSAIGITCYMMGRRARKAENEIPQPSKAHVDTV